MNICKTILEARTALQSIRSEGKSIGFVPTMGALHQGHLTLVESSKQRCDFTVASIFVNPAQFNNPEDLENYPSTLKEDKEKLIASGCDMLFLPSGQEIYPAKPQLKISLDGIANRLEGKFRPGHFDGVALVVSKLFNIIQPSDAFFGQKDLQQFFIVKSLIDQLNYPIKIKRVSTARESHGLAMSSRNMRLSEIERSDAALLYQALRQGREKLLQGTNAETVKAEIEELFNASERLALEYFEIINTDDFKATDATKEKEKVALCIAANIGQVRLIDNLMLIS